MSRHPDHARRSAPPEDEAEEPRLDPTNELLRDHKPQEVDGEDQFQSGQLPQACQEINPDPEKALDPELGANRPCRGELLSPDVGKEQ